MAQTVPPAPADSLHPVPQRSSGAPKRIANARPAEPSRAPDMMPADVDSEAWAPEFFEDATVQKQSKN